MTPAWLCIPAMETRGRLLFKSAFPWAGRDAALACSIAILMPFCGDGPVGGGNLAMDMCEAGDEVRREPEGPEAR